MGTVGIGKEWVGGDWKGVGWKGLFIGGLAELDIASVLKTVARYCTCVGSNPAPSARWIGMECNGGGGIGSDWIGKVSASVA